MAAPRLHAAVFDEIVEVPYIFAAPLQTWQTTLSVYLAALNPPYWPSRKSLDSDYPGTVLPNDQQNLFQQKSARTHRIGREAKAESYRKIRNCPPYQSSIRPFHASHAPLEVDLSHLKRLLPQFLSLHPSSQAL